MLNLQPVQIFSKVKGNSEFPENSHLTGDVLSHIGIYYSLIIGVTSEVSYGMEQKIKVEVLQNPSHLEVVVLF